jgi:hypothetical protein
MSEDKAQTDLKAESARVRWRMSSTFQIGLQRSIRTLDRVLKPVLFVA